MALPSDSRVGPGYLNIEEELETMNERYPVYSKTRLYLNHETQSSTSSAEEASLVSKVE